MDGPSFIDFLLWFAFDSANTGKVALYSDSKAWNALAFAVISAASFGAIVLVDLSAVIVTRIGFRKSSAGALGLQHGWGTCLVILFGAVGAWIVGLLAVMIDMFQVKAQMAVLCGIAWQVVYAKIIERAGASTGGAAHDDAGADVRAGVVEQTATSEEIEAN